MLSRLKKHKDKLAKSDKNVKFSEKIDTPKSPPSSGCRDDPDGSGILKNCQVNGKMISSPTSTSTKETNKLASSKASSFPLRIKLPGSHSSSKDPHKSPTHHQSQEITNSHERSSRVSYS